MPQVPAATRTLRVLRFLAAQPAPVPVERIAAACGLPRSSAYHLLAAMAAEGFVTAVPEEHRFGLGPAAVELASGYARQEPLARLSRVPLAHLVEEVGQSAHLAVLHGRDVLYVLEERAPGRPSLVTDVGVRLPAHLTASGRAILAALPAAQVRALFPDRRAFADRRGLGPSSPTALRALLADTRQRGFATELGEVTEGFASVGSAVRDHTGLAVAAVAVTYPAGDPAGGAGVDAGVDVAGAVRRTADTVAHRLGYRE